MSKITDKEKQQIYKLFEEGMNGAQIARKVGHSKDGVIKVLNKAGYCTSRDIFKVLTEEEIVDICQMYLEKVPTQKIVDKYIKKFRTQNTVMKIVKNRGITPRTTGYAPIIKQEDFFETIDSEEKAYLIGFLITDGYVIYPNRKNRSPFWGITLQLKDRYILEWIKNIIGSNKKILEQRNEAVLMITSFKMVEDLKQYGIVPKKSRQTFLPKISKELMPHLIRGIFDGDGCISGQTCSFFGYAPFLSEINKTLSVELGMEEKIVRKTDTCDAFGFSAKEDVSKFYDYIYKDATIFLIRKKNRFEELEFIKNRC